MGTDIPLVPESARSIAHAAGRHVALPLGGIGTGNLALGADGALKQWQLHHLGNHRGELPGAMFALRVAQWEPPSNEIRVLQAPPAPPEQTRTPMVNDDHVPTWQRELLTRHRGVQGTTFRGIYPAGRIDYHDDALPVTVSLEAMTPLVPLDTARSSLPAALFTVRITNRSEVSSHGWFGAAMQNLLGADGALPPDGVRAPGYGGNTNRTDRRRDWTALVMDNHTLAPDHHGAGQVVLAADTPGTTALPAFTSADQFLAFLGSRQPFGPRDWAHMPASMADPQPTGTWSAAGLSPEGSTWNGGLAVPFHLEPGQSTQLRLALTWHLPNRYVNFTQFGGIRPEWGASRYFIGNHYTNQFADALDVLDTVAEQWEPLHRDTATWIRTLTESSLGEQAIEHLAALSAVIRSPSFFRTADGRLYGFEGVQGESTTMWSGDVGGSCPLNCTHVFTYEQGLAKLFPELERDMRETDFDVLQAPDGSIPHRLILPTSLGQLWDRSIGGPDEPALDGMLGTVLKTYREVRTGAGAAWLARYRPNVEQVMRYVAGRWDPEGTGVLHGIQPSTHDIDLAGLNPFMGSLWLAALRAAEELARLERDTDAAAHWRSTFEHSSAAYDEMLFTGEYYRQVLEDGDPREFQWGEGCLADQLFGQWWAHTLELGYLLPAEHVRTALQAVVRHNLRTDFTGFTHPYRVFADGDETGLVVCTWPHGGRPEVPTRYADEVWTGVEQQVAAHCLMEGMQDEAEQILTGLWSRYDGRRRNPYNQVECGDHYVRALSGWSVLEARTGQRWNAATGVLRISLPPPGGAWPVLLDTGWGSLLNTDDGPYLECRHGSVEVAGLELTTPDGVSTYGPVRLQAGEERRLRAGTSG
ncbi:hypothetical protein IM660_11205 [Ruania alkalisoli]|uniref:Glycosyl-hydrolase family 116 catalytic region domain-containing protein n=1 Tax=Ruania alkalisoli TaxID=2779775 RepID=A0A7M1SP70_9MICO|nr:GH116 family glycosyl-hydrolase [Ruania alkalisoli]QOR69275.1 hypothetical protein IM660_11205 [Ruania alkalisoli]